MESSLTSKIEFKCSSCDETHSGLPDMGFDMPAHVAQLSFEEQAARAILTADTCILDGKSFFVRCSLLLPIKGKEQEFGWSVWVTASKENFERFNELNENSCEGEMDGWAGYLSNQLPEYGETINLICRVHPQGNGFRPLLEMEPTEHRLSIDQQHGMPLDMAIKIIENTLHG